MKTRSWFGETMIGGLHGATLVLLALAGTSMAGITPGNYERSIVFGGEPRFYSLHVPPGYDGSLQVPLVLDFHGFTANKSDQQFLSGFDTLSDAEGFIVAYPQGLFGQPGDPQAANPPDGPSWNAGTCCGAALDHSIDDVGFARAVVDAVAVEANVNIHRVYATGLSNGGALVQRLACEAADTFAAVAPVAFPVPFNPSTLCTPARPIAVIHFAGLTDTVVPYSGGMVTAGTHMLNVVSAADSFAHWRDADGCGAGPPDETIVTGNSRCERYLSCLEGVEASLCSITSTSGAPNAGHILYQNQDLNVAQTAWAFLSRFSLPPECPPTPRTGCRSAAKSSLQIVDKSKDSADKLTWNWTKGTATTAAEFGDPTNGSAGYTLCVYDEVSGAATLLLSAAAPAGGTCAKGKACWKRVGSATPKGFAYADTNLTPEGLQKITLTAGTAGKAKIVVTGKGVNLRTPTLPVPAGSVTVQLVRGGSDTCWESVYPAPAIKNTSAEFKDTLP